MSIEERKSKRFTNPLPKNMYSSSTPIKLYFDPVSRNSYNPDNNCTMIYQKIYAGIYLTSAKDLCSANDLKIFGFTHIIFIDKHVIASNSGIVNCSKHKSNGQKLAANGLSTDLLYGAGTSLKASIAIKQSAQSSTSTHMLEASAANPSTPSNRYEIICSTSSPSFSCHEPAIDVDLLISKMDYENIFGHSDFEILDLNFGESSYLTTVLPNCYKAVKFIEKALKNNGAVLVIDCIGESQKCITIVIGFLMYKHSISYVTAYQLIKRLHPDLELDKFFTTQLYEYEPILQVQRSQSAGNSCSRELRSTLLKRKKPTADEHICERAEHHINNIEHTTDILME